MKRGRVQKEETETQKQTDKRAFRRERNRQNEN